MEAELIRSCRNFPEDSFSALDPCAGEGRAMAVITASSQAVRYGIELDSYRAEAATKVLDHVIHGDALSAHARIESFGLAYCNPPFDAEFGESGNQRFEVLFLSHFARWLVAGGVLIYVLPAQQLAGCAHVLASHFRDVQVFRLESPECVLYGQVVVFAIARSRRERDRTRDSEISFCRNRLVSTAHQHDMLPVLSERRVELRVPPTGPAEVSYAGLPFDTIEDLLPSSSAYRQVAQMLDPQPILLSTRPVTPLHKGQIGPKRNIVDFCCKPFRKRLFSRWRHSIGKMFYRMRSLPRSLLLLSNQWKDGVSIISSLPALALCHRPEGANLGFP
jgi:predicted RNA methylase